MTCKGFVIVSHPSHSFFMCAESEKIKHFRQCDVYSDEIFIVV